LSRAAGCRGPAGSSPLGTRARPAAALRAVRCRGVRWVLAPALGALPIMYALPHTWPTRSGRRVSTRARPCPLCTRCHTGPPPSCRARCFPVAASVAAAVAISSSLHPMIRRWQSGPAIASWPWAGRWSLCCRRGKAGREAGPGPQRPAVRVGSELRRDAPATGLCDVVSSLRTA
jgi:hypothetical protein